MFDDPNKRESFYHSALIYSKRLDVGTDEANNKAKELLGRYRTFEAIFRELHGLFHEDSLREVPNINAIRRSVENSGDFKVLKFFDGEFPQSLREVPDSTPVLYVSGYLRLFDSKSMAVVGTRKPMEKEYIDGEKRAVQELIDRDYVVVSGLARGCDTLAHEYAIEHDGRTIAVLGTPLDHYYPEENRRLQDKIASQHLLVSQYPVGIRTFPQYFAHRNKTTVGLSDGVIVISASDRSGTQHAIKSCVEQGKPLYVLERNLDEGYHWTATYRDKMTVINRGEKCPFI